MAAQETGGGGEEQTGAEDGTAAEIIAYLNHKVGWWRQWGRWGWVGWCGVAIRWGGVELGVGWGWVTLGDVGWRWVALGGVGWGWVALGWRWVGVGLALGVRAGCVQCGMV